MYCPSCGAQYDDSFAFCTDCGAKNPYVEQPPAQVAPVPQAPTPQPPAQYPVVVQQKSTSGCLIALAVVGILTLIVIVIIIAIVLVAASAQSNAQRRTCQSNQRTVDGAIQAYEAMFNEPTFPTSLDDLVQPDTQTLMSIPTCPSGNEPYIWVDGSPPTISCPNNASHTI